MSLAQDEAESWVEWEIIPSRVAATPFSRRHFRGYYETTVINCVVGELARICYESSRTAAG